MPLLLCLIGALLLRADSLLLTSVDWDESIYMLAADSLAAGAAPYEAVWDHKPPGVYWIYWLAKALPGPDLLNVRLLACAAVAASALLAQRIARHVTGVDGCRTWLPAGLVLVTFRLFGGLSANSEVFLAPLAAASVLCLLRQRMLLAGAFAAAACWIKPNVAIDVGAALLAIFAVRRCWSDLARFALGGLLAGALPLLAAGNLATLWDAVVAANLRHGGDRQTLGSAFWWLLRSADDARLLAALAAAGVTLACRGGPLFVPCGWFAGALLSAFAAGQPYDHYLVEAVVPLCVLAGSVAALVLRQLPQPMQLPAGAVLLLAATPTSAARAPLEFLRALRTTEPVDAPAAVADAIQRHGAPGSVYVVDTEPIVYHLLGLSAPTRFPFPPLLLGEHFGKVAAIDQRAEIARILATDPEWLVRSTTPWPGYASGLALVNERAAADYEPIVTVGGTQLLRRRMQR